MLSLCEHRRASLGNPSPGSNGSSPWGTESWEVRLCPTEEVKDRAGKMAQWIKVLAARQDNLILISEIHMVEAEN